MPRFICLDPEESNEPDYLKKIENEYFQLNYNHWSLIKSGDRNLERTRKLISIYRKERKNVNLDLQIAKACLNSKEGQKVWPEIRKLLDENSIIDEQTIAIKNYIKETDLVIRKTDEEKHNLVKVQAATESRKEKHKVEMLERKLLVENQKFGSLQKENEKLREEIENLLKERKKFNIQFEKVMKRLKKVKMIMMDIMGQAFLTYNKRDECIQNLKMLRTKAYQDYKKDIDEYQKIKIDLVSSEKFLKLLQIKFTKRTWHSSKAKSLAEKNVCKIQFYENLDKIENVQRQFQIFDVDSIGKKFQINETINFSQMKQIVDLNREIENIADYLKIIYPNIEKQIVKHKTFLSKQQQTLINLHLKLKKTFENVVSCDRNLESKDQQIDNNLILINYLSDLLNCEQTYNFPTKDNVIHYLEEVDQKIREIVLSAVFKQEIDKKKVIIDKKNKLIIDICRVDDYVPNTPCPLCVEVEMVSQVSDNLNFAWTRYEVKNYLEQRLKFSDGTQRLHSLYKCRMPKAKEHIII